jgi:hypothetical protein
MPGGRPAKKDKDNHKAQLSRLELFPDTSSGELRSCPTLGAYPQDKFDLPASL